ncbi:MAG TPA: alpha-amylase family glycosyl hydrolase, partial [Kofleriaceae bacterium]|nr:alpha-amylase family glycosyl hydrolase [Kofleriaceae bacterium]
MRHLFPIILFAALLPACAPPSGGDGQPDGGPNAPDSGVIDTPDAGGAPDAMEPATCTETFRLEGYASATEVVLTGTLVTPAWAGTVAAGGIAMSRSGDAWVAELTLEPGTYQYKFVVDGTWIADPGNPTTVDDGFGGTNSVYSCGAQTSCGDPDEFDWRDAVMYFAMVDRFFDADSNASPVANASGMDAYGNSGQYEGGDLPGMRQKVPYLAELGVTAIWLSAPYDNRDTAGAAIDGNDPHQYSGYHGYWPKPVATDYSNMSDPQPRPLVESRIGSETDLKMFVQDAHAATSANGQGIKVLFDYVMNHVDIESDLYAAHWDWFARDSNNQFALCGPGNLWNDPYWGTRCAFTSYLPPFDFSNPAARAWSIDDAMWWAKEYGIDGYRLDAIKHVPFEWLTDLRARLNSDITDPAGGRFYLVGETFDYFDRDLLKAYVDPDTMLDGQFDFPFKRELCEGVFNPTGSLSGFAGFMGGNDGYYDRGPSKRAIMTTWIGNHDIPRAIHFADWTFGNCTEGSHTGNGWTGNYSQPTGATPYQRLGLAFAVMMTNPGIPLIYYGDEIGLAGGGDPGNRRMMVWNDAELNQHQLALRASVKQLANLRGRLKALGRDTRTTL